MFTMDGFLPPDECRARAEECRRMAEAASAEWRGEFVAMAEEWERLALQYEALARIRLWVLTGKLTDDPPRH